MSYNLNESNICFTLVTVPVIGLEPTAFSLEENCAIQLRHTGIFYLGEIILHPANELQHTQALDKYNTNPKLCQECESPIPYKKRINKFCNSSCAATKNNVLYQKRTLEGCCITCGTPIHSSHKFCKKHAHHKGEPSNLHFLELTHISWTPEQLQVAILESKTMKEVCVKIGLSQHSATYIRRCADKLNIDYSNILNDNTVYTPKVKSLLELLLNPKTKTTAIKAALIRESILENKCSICGISDWQDKPAPLELDHIDGNRFNNEISNFRIICCNCHAQTDTYKSKNRKNRAKLTDPENKKLTEDRKRYNNDYHSATEYKQ